MPHFCLMLRIRADNTAKGPALGTFLLFKWRILYRYNIKRR